MEDKNTRNKTLLSFFKKTLRTDKIHLNRNLNSPAFIYDYKKVLACTVRESELLLKEDYRGRVLDTLEITKNITYDPKKLKEWFKNSTHRKCYTIRVKDKTLRLAGWNFLFPDKNNPKGKYPVFSEEQFNIYFQKHIAEDIAFNYAEGVELVVE
ncbi:hypothetical protein [Aquimarina algiphila]|uniref:Uncharacterized protein n=1 Tax=Aquimarina algiphila TaxID=2047982 RepID=A0A554VRN7_9FLAO|nr:hypothetical protein [Aquimarina algiphila]TSE11306.1 hypothetical protein FOF46_01360 [Aquimarina algiphila]